MGDAPLRLPSVKMQRLSVERVRFDLGGGPDSTRSRIASVLNQRVFLPLLTLFLFTVVILLVAASFGQLAIGILVALFMGFSAAIFMMISKRSAEAVRFGSMHKINHMLVESHDEPSVIVDEDGALIVANQAYGQAFPGYPAPSRDVEGFTVRRTVLPDSKNSLLVFKELSLKNDISQSLNVDEIHSIFNGLGLGLLILGEDQNIADISENLLQWLECEKSAVLNKTREEIFLSFGSERAVFDRGQGDPLIFELVELPAEAVPAHRCFGFIKPEAQSKSFMSDDEIANIPEQLFDQAPAGIALIDESGQLKRFNDPLRRLSGQELVLGEGIEKLFLETDRDAVAKTIETAVKTQATPLPVEVRFAGESGHVAQLFARGLQGGTGAVLYLIDTTEQKQLELQFTQAQKMQAVGQLAGGIAHDFNNILTAIIGFCDLLLVRHGAGDASFSDIMQIKQNANRAANLVRQLLAFSRQQTLRPSVLLITDVLAELSNLLRRLIGENIELNMRHGRDLGHVKVDQGQLEQVIINLVVNARDAMPKGGRLMISTSNLKQKDVEGLGHGVMPEQDYVCVVVEDTGHGIPKNLLSKVFDPFFTTKDVGKGTGLGLSTVYGIVKQTGGFIFAGESETGGACFTIYLPVHISEEQEKPAAQQAKAQAQVTDLWGHGTILLVEDEDAVRTFAYRALDKKGYKVIEADSGEAALEAAREYDGQIDLILSDVIMPNMDGPTMVSQLRDILPDAKIIFISGYAQDSFRNGFEQEEHHFLPKPFSLSQLAEKVKSVLSED